MMEDPAEREWAQGERLELQNSYKLIDTLKAEILALQNQSADRLLHHDLIREVAIERQARIIRLMEEKRKLQKLVSGMVEALTLLSYTQDFGAGAERCWCASGFHDGMPDDSEPDFHSTLCQDIKRFLAEAKLVTKDVV